MVGVVQIRGRAAPVAGGMHQCQGCAATLTSTGGRRYPAGSVVDVQGSLGEIGETQAATTPLWRCIRTALFVVVTLVVVVYLIVRFGVSWSMEPGRESVRLIACFAGFISFPLAFSNGGIHPMSSESLIDWRGLVRMPYRSVSFVASTIKGTKILSEYTCSHYCSHKCSVRAIGTLDYDNLLRAEDQIAKSELGAEKRRDKTQCPIIYHLK